MRRQRLGDALLFSVSVICALSGAQASGQSTVREGLTVRIAYASADSVGLLLADSGYVLVVEYARRKPRVIYPSYGDEWTLVAPGPTTLHVPVSVVVPGHMVEEPSPQCIVDPRGVRSWSVETGLLPSGSRTACGPVPSRRPHPSADEPFWDPAALFYEFPSPFRSYIVAWLFDSRVPPRGLGGLSPATDILPVVLARRTGQELTRRPAQDQLWHAAAWIIR